MTLKECEYIKKSIISKTLTTEEKIYIIDTADEYKWVAARFPDDTEVVDMMSGATKFINPLDLYIDFEGIADPVSMKISFIEEFMGMIFGDAYVLSPIQKSILTKCAKALYSQYIIHLRQTSDVQGRSIIYDYDATPTIRDLYELLIGQTQPEATQMAFVLEIYCTDDCSMFSHKTNINPQKRILIYNIRNLREDLKKLGLFVCMDDAWNRMIIDSKAGKIANIYIG